MEEITSNFIHEELSLYLFCSRNISEGMSCIGKCNVFPDILSSLLRHNSMVSHDLQKAAQRKDKVVLAI